MEERGGKLVGAWRHEPRAKSTHRDQTNATPLLGIYADAGCVSNNPWLRKGRRSIQNSRLIRSLTLTSCCEIRARSHEARAPFHSLALLFIVNRSGLSSSRSPLVASLAPPFHARQIRPQRVGKPNRTQSARKRNPCPGCAFSASFPTRFVDLHRIQLANFIRVSEEEASKRNRGR